MKVHEAKMMDGNYSVKVLKELSADVNVNEISDHIKHGTLAQWVESWQAQMALEIENCRRSNETLRRENFGLKTTVRNLPSF